MDFIQIRLLIEFNQTEHMEAVGVGVCIEFKLFDENLCIAGMREYGVKLIFFFSSF